MGVRVGTQTDTVEVDKKVLLELTKRCNYFCAHCYTEASPWVHTVEPQPSQVHTLLTSLRKLGFPMVTLSGGELMLRSDIDTIVLSAPEGIKQWLFTSGIGIDDRRLKQWQHLVYGYCVSLDGGSQLHNRLRRSSRAFSDVIEFLRRAAHAGVRIQLQCMVLRQELEHIHVVVELAETLGVEGILFSHVSPDGRGREMQDAWLSPGDMEILYTYVQELQARTPVHLFTNLMPKDLIAKRFPKPVLHIQPDGRVLPWFGAPASHAIACLAETGWDLEHSLADIRWKGRVQVVFERAKAQAIRYEASVVPVDDLLVQAFRETVLCT